MLRVERAVRTRQSRPQRLGEVKPPVVCHNCPSSSLAGDFVCHDCSSSSLVGDFMAQHAHTHSTMPSGNDSNAQGGVCSGQKSFPTAALLPGLPDDVALLCLARVGKACHGQCRSVCNTWRHVFGSPRFYEKRKELGMLEPVLMVRVLIENSASHEWRGILVNSLLQEEIHATSKGEPHRKGIVHGCESSSLESSALESSALESSALESSALESSTLETSPLESSSLKSSAFESSPLESSALAEESRTSEGSFLGELAVQSSTQDQELSGRLMQPTANPGNSRSPQTWYRFRDAPFHDKCIGGSSVAVSGGDLYLCGGVSGCARATKEVFRLSCSTGRWEPAPLMKTARAYSGCWVLPNGNIMVAGGHTEGLKELCTTEIYNVGSRTWEEGAQMPSEMTKFDCATWRGKLLISEGWEWPFHFSPRGFEYDVTRGTWGLAATGLTEGWMGVSAVGGGHLIAIDQQQPGTYQLVHYNPETDTWHPIPGSVLPAGPSPPWTMSIWGAENKAIRISGIKELINATLYLVGSGLSVSVGTLSYHSHSQGSPVDIENRETRPMDADDVALSVTWSGQFSIGKEKGAVSNLSAIVLM